MKKILVLMLMLAVAIPMSGIALAEGGFTTESENIESAVTNFRTTGGDMIQGVAQETSKGTNTGEHLTGVAMGGIVGLRKGVHRLGAGAIDLLTFWIPKKEPLVEPSTFE